MGEDTTVGAHMSSAQLAESRSSTPTSYSDAEVSVSSDNDQHGIVQALSQLAISSTSTHSEIQMVDDPCTGRVSNADTIFGLYQSASILLS